RHPACAAPEVEHERVDLEEGPELQEEEDRRHPRDGGVAARKGARVPAEARGSGTGRRAPRRRGAQVRGRSSGCTGGEAGEATVDLEEGDRRWPQEGRGGARRAGGPGPAAACTGGRSSRSCGGDRART